VLLTGDAAATRLPADPGLPAEPPG
jgi:hypothetical protein